MKIIIFAGGTGKRFWPASRAKSPKQFLNVIGNKPLIRLKYEYLKKGFKPKDIYLSTGIQYKKEVKEILPELPEENLIFEPEMRDSGPAVALAVKYISQKYPRDVISTQWSDHYIKNVGLFISVLKKSEKLVKEKDKSLIIGVPPRYPSSHWGYIKFGKKIKGLGGGDRITLCKFKRFVEKPTFKVAKEFVRSGDYSWNPGYFVSTPEKILKKYSEFAPNILKAVDEFLFKKKVRKFSKLKRIAFDYIFAENLNQDEAYVINADMGWSDIGEWTMLKETLEKSKDAIVAKGNVNDKGSKDSLIYNYEKDKLIASVGLKEIIVVNTEDVTLVIPKKESSKLKEFLKSLEGSKFEKYL